MHRITPLKSRALGVAAVAGALGVLTMIPALASPKSSSSSGYSLFGDATLVHPGEASPTAAEATSTGPNGYGGVDFAFPSGLTVSQVDNLATDYMFPVGSCGLGSPRFVASVTNGTASGDISFYIGPPPEYTGCPPNVWTSSGNLASPTNLVDTSQLPGGSFYEPYAAAQTQFGSYTVTDIFLAVDGPGQTVDFDNTQVNNTTYTYESGDSCKGGGYQQFTSNPGPFSNQGQCVSYFAHQK
jgi:hypothetical protein